MIILVPTGGPASAAKFIPLVSRAGRGLVNWTRYPGSSATRSSGRDLIIPLAPVPVIHGDLSYEFPEIETCSPSCMTKTEYLAGTESNDVKIEAFISGTVISQSQTLPSDHSRCTMRIQRLLKERSTAHASGMFNITGPARRVYVSRRHHLYVRHRQQPTVKLREYKTTEIGIRGNDLTTGRMMI